MKEALAELRSHAELDHHLDGEAVAVRLNCRNHWGQKIVLMDIGRGGWILPAIG
ncbi:hypothetical protein GCM10023157_10840 [Gluconacetobacter asukensis]|uniref:hypothetical protein n=1 Tax=Gluconacetobacter asukensis TaxID=1017181 RepID=UPI001FEAC478|nr:hypothetical protein [Gluconacetobacter asukensis]